MSAQAPPATLSDTNFKDLKDRMKLIADADPNQYHNELSLRRYLRAFKTVDAAFQVLFFLMYELLSMIVCVYNLKLISNVFFLRQY
jgi:hypothetical protein